MNAMERSRDWMDQARTIRYAEQIIKFCESLLSQTEPS